MSDPSFASAVSILGNPTCIANYLIHTPEVSSSKGIVRDPTTIVDFVPSQSAPSQGPTTPALQQYAHTLTWGDMGLPFDLGALTVHRFISYREAAGNVHSFAAIRSLPTVVDTAVLACGEPCDHRRR
jgi:hypothetical protein